MTDSSLLVDFMNEFQLPQDFLDKEFSDIENLVTSIEPVLPEGLFPALDQSIDSKEVTESSSFTELASETFLSNDIPGTDEATSIGDQSRDKTAFVVETSETDTCVSPATTSLSLVPTKPLSKEAIQIINLCESEEEDSEAATSEADSIITIHSLEGPEADFLTMSLLGRGSVLEGQKALMHSVAFVPIDQQEKKRNKPMSGSISCERKGKPLASRSIPGPAYTIDDVCGLMGLKDATKLKDLRQTKKPKLLKIKSQGEGKVKQDDKASPKMSGKRKSLNSGTESLSKITLEAGLDVSSHKEHPAGLGSEKSQALHKYLKATSDAILSDTRGKRKIILIEAESLCKASRMEVELDAPRPESLQAGDCMMESEKIQASHQGEDKKTSGAFLLEMQQEQDLPLPGAESLTMTPRVHLEMVFEEAYTFRNVQSNLQPENHPAKMLCEKKAKKTTQLSPANQKIKIFIPDLEPFEKKHNLDVDSSDYPLKDLRAEMNNWAPEKNQSRNQGKETGTGNVNLLGFKGKRKHFKMEVEPLKQIPRSNLALQMLESVQVFYPLGKNNISSMPGKKCPVIPPSSNGILEKSQTKPARSLSKTLPSLLPTSVTRHPPALLPMPVPQPSLAYSYDLKTSSLQLPQTSRWRAAPPSLESFATLPDVSAPVLWKPRGKKLQVPSLSTQPLAMSKDHPLYIDYSPPPPCVSATAPYFLPVKSKTSLEELEVSLPITEEQRPIREMMKKQAQEEREEAACWTSVGRVKFFVEREKEMDISIMFGYPWHF